MILFDQHGKLINTRTDSWINPFTGYGGSDDNIENTQYHPDPRQTEQVANSLFENSGVIARGIEAPVKDRLSRGVQYLTNDEDTDSRKKEIESVESDFKASKFWSRYVEAAIWARLHGGGLLYFDYGDDRNFQFQDFRRTVNFELKDSQRGMPNKIWSLDRWFAIPQSYYTEAIHGVDHPKLGEVETYSLNLHTTGYARLVFAHESRVIKVDGLPLANRSRAANHTWGNSVLTRIFKVARFLGVSLKGMTDILEDWNYKSLGIPNLADKLISNKAEDIRAMLSAVAMAAKSAHNQNIGIHDLEGNLTKHMTTAAGITDVVQLLVNFLCGELGIPYSRLFSSEGGALAGTAADTDVKNYHESLRYDQKHKDAPNIERALWLLGYEPENFPFLWPALRESTRKEEIEERKAQAEVDVLYIQNSVLAPEEVAISRFSNPETNLDQTIVDFSARKEMSADEEGEPEEPKEEEEDASSRTDTEDEDELRFELTDKMIVDESLEVEVVDETIINPEDIE